MTSDVAGPISLSAGNWNIKQPMPKARDDGQAMRNLALKRTEKAPW